ncbi:unnamed protein product [Prorocentrum cordatum]|uniref:Uncharacterized protein n=1 Tax=Prorocentrum cordatum TaxID=2364126 RepID=A0ABN9TXY4_9DINO|nr:unnamed protein product [Polarella glacialis]
MPASPGAGSSSADVVAAAASMNDESEQAADTVATQEEGRLHGHLHPSRTVAAAASKADTDATNMQDEDDDGPVRRALPAGAAATTNALEKTTAMVAQGICAGCRSLHDWETKRLRHEVARAVCGGDDLAAFVLARMDELNSPSDEAAEERAATGMACAAAQTAAGPRDRGPPAGSATEREGKKTGKRVWRWRPCSAMQPLGWVGFCRRRRRTSDLSVREPHAAVAAYGLREPLLLSGSGPRLCMGRRHVNARRHAGHPPRRQDALRAFEAAGRGPAAAEGAAEPPEERPGGAAEQAARRVPVEPAAAEQVRASLRAAAFSEYPGGLFAHLDRGVTVSVGDSLEVTVDGIESEDLADWSLLQLEQDPAVFGEGLLEWATAQRSEQPGFAEGGEGDVVAGDFADFLPDPAALSVQQHRDLTIYTWGKAFRKVAPADSQANFNAGILNGRGGGADISRVDNGLTEAVQKNVASCALFPRWLEMCINKIESEGLHAVSINCTKGRHRSVAAAEILRAYYYPDAVVIHTSPAIKRPRRRAAAAILFDAWAPEASDAASARQASRRPDFPRLRADRGAAEASPAEPAGRRGVPPLGGGAPQRGERRGPEASDAASAWQASRRPGFPRLRADRGAAEASPAEPAGRRGVPPLGGGAPQRGERRGPEASDAASAWQASRRPGFPRLRADRGAAEASPAEPAGRRGVPPLGGGAPQRGERRGPEASDAASAWQASRRPGFPRTIALLAVALRASVLKKDPTSRSVFHRAQCAWQLGCGESAGALADGVFESGEPDESGGPDRVGLVTCRLRHSREGDAEVRALCAAMGTSVLRGGCAPCGLRLNLHLSDVPCVSCLGSTLQFGFRFPGVLKVSFDRGRMNPEDTVPVPRQPPPPSKKGNLLPYAPMPPEMNAKESGAAAGGVDRSMLRKEGPDVGSITSFYRSAAGSASRRADGAGLGGNEAVPHKVVKGLGGGASQQTFYFSARPAFYDTEDYSDCAGQR